MTEIGSDTEYSPPGIRGKFSDNPEDSTVAQASRLLTELRSRNQVVLENFDYTNPPASIVISPECSRYRIIRAGQIPADTNKRQKGASVHKIGFGNLEVRNGDGRAKAISVAFKQYDLARAFHEFVHTIIIRSRSFSTLRPIAAIFGDEVSYGISYAESVQTLDLEPWHQMHDHTRPEISQHFLGRLNQITKLLAKHHVRGIRHGDPQIKNFWVKPLGTLEAIDYESSEIGENPSPPEQLLKFANKDLNKVFISLTQPNPDFQTQVLMGDRQAQYDQFNLLIKEPYIQTVLEEYPQVEERSDILEALDSISI